MKSNRYGIRAKHDAEGPLDGWTAISGWDVIERATGARLHFCPEQGRANYLARKLNRQSEARVWHEANTKKEVRS